MPFEISVATTILLSLPSLGFCTVKLWKRESGVVLWAKTALGMYRPPAVGAGLAQPSSLCKTKCSWSATTQVVYLYYYHLSTSSCCATWPDSSWGEATRGKKVREAK